jgi:hypothetical protein
MQGVEGVIRVKAKQGNQHPHPEVEPKVRRGKEVICHANWIFELVPKLG